MNRLKIGILMGVFSSERQVSLKSGSAVAIALGKLGYSVSILDFYSKEELLYKLREQKFDCVFNALHGRFGEDGQVQKILDDLDIPYTGSGVNASRLAMDKVASKIVFQENGLLVTPWQVMSKSKFSLNDINIEFPLVVKPVHEGSSIGLSIVESPGFVLEAIKKAFNFDEIIMLEKYIKGREMTVGMLEDNPLPLIEIVPKNRFYDFQAKYTAGMTEYLVPVVLPEETRKKVQEIASKAHNLLGCSCFSRIDIILDEDNNPFILEVNTIPGLTATSLLPKAAAACGIDFEQLCEKMLLAALKKVMK
ncbi:MAG: D-alanine--D-alanine ligase [Candidatus Omnitrophica bacterium]|nr:D-alanine--D-alanine ligase [Candidatus Omnitrophota bacterium]